MFFFLGCKKLTLEIEETKCKKIRLKNPSYARVTSLCSNGDQHQAIDVSFDFDGDAECLYLIDFKKIKFVNSSGQNMNSINYSDDDLLMSDNRVTITGNSVTFHYCYEFNNASDTSELGYIQLNWQTENDLENESNSIGIRINFNTSNGSTDPNVYEHTYTSDEQTIQLLVWDNADEDGDIISINHNGTWIRENLFITNAPKTIIVTLTRGHNFLNFYAVNQGDAGPNTLSAQIQANGRILGNFNLQGQTGEINSVEVKYVP